MSSTTTNKKGFTLIELVISIFILVFAIIGVYSAFSNVVVLTTGSSSRLTAAYLSQEGIEIVRNIRDTNWIQSRDWTTGLLNCASGCEADYKTGTSQDTRSGLTPFGGGGNYLNIGADSFYSYDSNPNFIPTTFKRRITIMQVSTDVLKISVLVTWEDKGVTSSIQAEEYLYNWY